MAKTLKKQAQKKNNRNLSKKRNFEYVRAYKEYHKCCECGEGRAVCLDLHHKRPETKKFSLSDGKSHSIKTIDAELKKCIVVCANCHRLIHAEKQFEMKRLELEQEKTLYDE